MTPPLLLQNASWKDLEYGSLGTPEFLNAWLVPDSPMWPNQPLSLTLTDWIPLGANPQYLSLFQMLWDCRLIGPQSDLIHHNLKYASHLEIEGFYQEETHPLQSFDFYINTPERYPSFKGVEGYLSYFRPYLAYSNTSDPTEPALTGFQSKMILKHPNGVITLTFELYKDDFGHMELHRIFAEALVAPPEWIDSLVASAVQQEMDQNVAYFFGQLEPGLDPALKPLLRKSLMNHPLLQSTFSEYVLEQSLSQPEPPSSLPLHRPRL